MKNSLFTLTVVLTASLLAVSCSKPGMLSVNNKSDEIVEGDIDGKGGFTLDPNESVEKTWTLKSSIFSSEDIDVNVSGEGYFVFPFDRTARVKAGETTQFNITADAGVICIYNNYDLSIVELYVSLSSSATWGSDTLWNYFGPGQTKCIRLEPEVWDIRAVFSDYSTYADWFDVSLDIEAVEPLVVTDSYAGPQHPATAARITSR